MQVLITSVEYGRTRGPEGICTQRFARALAARGVGVEIFAPETAADEEPGERQPQLTKISSRPVIPGRIHQSATKWTRRFFTESPWWPGRVARTHPGRIPDVVYGRANPLLSHLAAWRLARALKRPLILHFSDPIPVPWETTPPGWLVAARKQVAKLVPAAAALTFTTDGAIDVQEEILGVSLRAKSFVLPHVAPPPCVLPHKDAGGRLFVYVGAFYASRRATELLTGFKKLLRDEPDARMHFVGTHRDHVIGEIERLGLGEQVTVLPRTSDVTPHLAEADVLVGVDAHSGPPVFLATKLVEYLMVDRPVLQITPRGSVAWELVSRHPGAAAAVEPDPDAICAAMQRLSSAAITPEAYQERFAQMSEFSPEEVSGLFAENVSKLLSGHFDADIRR